MDYDKILLYYLLLESLEEKPKPRHIRHIHNTTVEGVTSHPLLKDVEEYQHHHHAYGEIYTHDNIVASAAALQNTWYQLTIFDKNGPYHECVNDHTNDHITVGLTGDYMINCAVTLFDAQTQDWEFAIYTNNGANYLDNVECQATTLAASKVLSTAFCGIVSLTANDTVEVWYKCISAAAQDVTVKLVNLSLFRML